MCLVAVAPPGWPLMSDVLPRAVIRDTRFRVRGCAVEQLRLAARDDLDALPGLGNGGRSRLLDAVRLALHAGLASVDVLLARAPGAGPTDLCHEDVIQALDPALADIPGVMLLFPDLAPWGDAPSSREQIVSWSRSLRAIAASWAERFQVGLLDAPMGPLGALEALWPDLVGLDGALCRWTGSDDALLAHGWRCPSAPVAAALVGERIGAGGSLIGRKVTLAPGRVVPPSRAEQLRLSRRLNTDGGRIAPTLDLAIQADNTVGIIQTEPSLRRPLGSWSLPCLRVVKAIHRRVVETCGRFVFETVDEGRATALGVAIQHALGAYIEAGMLVGPDQVGPPEIEGWPERNPETPALTAEISGWLQPWSQSVSMRVSVRPGLPPLLELA